MLDAIVAAGGVPRPGHPLYPLTQGQPKALLSIAGQPMAQWVLDALSAATQVRRVVVMGLPTDTALHCAKELTLLPDQGSLLENLSGGAKWLLQRDPALSQALAVSGDIPALTPAAVNWAVTMGAAVQDDGCYILVPKNVMEQRFPGSHRSYYRFKEGLFTGADMMVLSTRLVGDDNPLWGQLIAARKSIWQMAGLIGVGALARMVLGQMSLPDAEHFALTRLGARGRALISPHAEMGMDVDKPSQYALLKRDLAGRQGNK